LAYPKTAGHITKEVNFLVDPIHLAWDEITSFPETPFFCLLGFEFAGQSFIGAIFYSVLHFTLTAVTTDFSTTFFGKFEMVLYWSYMECLRGTILMTLRTEPG